MSARPVTVAIVGLGYGCAHAESIQLIEAATPGKVRLTAVVDPIDPATNERVLRTAAAPLVLSVPHYPSLSELLEREVPDVVVIATPLHTHRELALQALAAGAHLLLEKPPTATMADFQEVLSAARAAGRAVQVGVKARGGGALREARRAAHSGELGQLRHIGASATWHREHRYFARSPWAGRRSLDGVPVLDGAVTNALAHPVDAALMLAGASSAEDVARVELDWWHANDIEADDTTAVRVTLRDRVPVVAGLTLAGPPRSSASFPATVTAWGSEGALQVHYLTDLLVRLDASGREVGREQLGRVDLVENLADHLLSGAPLLAGLAQVGAYMQVLEAARLGAPPRAVPAQFLAETGEGLVLAEVGSWCQRVAREGRTFTELGAPWTR